ncbi:hypothetical protein CVT25_005861 [Psilocybe cyanescens]|uniref:Ribonuclease H1 N-terminal domain-containing protein n=1 Tax=Psilocybe cyanescens TaxID=93625 RepID=A0A409VM18_PSICY|nr:hypothetical protein CVT25_005861 [Psilocybe cyanescens]
MGKRKWYVVTVGKGIGVFPTWIEAGPLVKGVSEAIYQSFPSEEEARRLFAQEMLKGTTKVIRDEGPQSDRQPTPRSPPNRNLAYLNNGSSFRPSNSSPTSSIIRLNTQDATSIANQSESGRTGSQSDATFSHCPSLTGQFSSPLSRSASEPSASFVRAQKIEALFKKSLPVVGVRPTPASAKYAQALTPAKYMMEFTSPEIQSPQQPQGAIVKTPDWLNSYPQACQPHSHPLSPLNSEDIPLNSFSMGPDEASSMSRNAANSPSVGGSSIYLSPSPRQIKRVVYQYDMDPRSPVKSKFQVPELAFGR